MYQPCDVDLNKPLKDYVRKSWQDYIANQNNSGSFFNKPLRIFKDKPITLMREDVVQWVQHANKKLGFEDNVFFNIILRNLEEEDQHAEDVALEEKIDHGTTDDNSLFPRS